MDTLTVVLVLVGVMAVLLVGAVFYDRRLQERQKRRRMLEEHPELAPNKRDAADAVIDILDRTRQVMRDTLSAAGEGEPKST